MSLDKLFNPKNIAIIGASNRAGSVGNALINNLLHSKYKGTIYPVNPIRKRIAGLTANKSISEIPETIDLVIIATPAHTVPSILKECGLANVKSAVIISAGFNKPGESGKTLNKEISKIIKKYKIKTLGPNCLGFIRPSIHLNASFATQIPQAGKIALISQSGALCTSLLDWSAKNHIGFSKFISVGSMLDTNFADLLEYLDKDKETESIIIYIESLKDAQKFIKISKKVSRKKPIIALKVGRSEEGSSAAKSHTGSLTGNDQVFSAAFEQAGIIRVDSIQDLYGAAKILREDLTTIGDELTIITNAGGPGVIATDALIKNNGNLTHLNPRLLNRLNKILPTSWSKNNPIDIIGDAGPERYKNVVKACLSDRSVQALLVILTPQFMTNPSEVALSTGELALKYKKPVITCWMGDLEVSKGRELLQKASIPSFSTPEAAIKAYTIAQKAKKIKSQKNPILKQTDNKITPSKTKKEDNQRIIKKAISHGRQALTEAESKKFLKNYGLPTPKNAIAKTAQEAEGIAKKIGFPVAMKILSPDIIHKTEVRGVQLSINSKPEASKAFRLIKSSAKKLRPNAHIHGVIIEQMLTKKHELILGYKKDELFGPVILFGKGGTAVEVYKDYKLAIPPINMPLAEKTINNTKVSTILKGYRGQPGVDLVKLQTYICILSKIAEDFPEIKAIDINPLVIDETGAAITDAKILLEN